MAFRNSYEIGEESLNKHIFHILYVLLYGEK